MHVLLGSLSVLTAIYLFTLLSHFFVSNRRLCRLLAFISLRIPWVKVVPKARAIARMLTFTIEVSRLAMKMPTATMAKASHLFRWAPMNRSVSPAGSFCSNFILLFPSAPLSFLLRRCIERMMPSKAERNQQVFYSGIVQYLVNGEECKCAEVRA